MNKFLFVYLLNGYPCRCNLNAETCHTINQTKYCSATYESPTILWNKKVHHDVHMIPPLIPNWARVIQSIMNLSLQTKQEFY